MTLATNYPKLNDFERQKKKSLITFIANFSKLSDHISHQSPNLGLAREDIREFVYCLLEDVLVLPHFCCVRLESPFPLPNFYILSFSFLTNSFLLTTYSKKTWPTNTLIIFLNFTNPFFYFLFYNLSSLELNDAHKLAGG